DDHHALGAVAVLVGEVASFDQRNTERGEEARRHGSRAGAWIVGGVLAGAPFDREQKAVAEVAGIAPRHRAAERDALDARNRRHTPLDFAIEAADLLRRAAV